ncbi:hypothetical protein GCM10023322_53330 [Rugosimonospora acidiphila]|uniref:Integrase n=1 Tax=Rugosimonospora acidiphila TaxID=556531 RepID=A0ABP9SAP5_9ACTN
MKSRDVRVWDIGPNKGQGKKRTYTARWIVAGRETSKTFMTRALGDNFRSDLMRAINKGESFGTGSGLPDSMVEAKEATSWLEFAQSYVSMKWPGAAARSRDRHNERGLKHRGEDEPRVVPIPPELVAILRWHIERYGVTPDGRLFGSERDNVVSASNSPGLGGGSHVRTDSASGRPAAGRPALRPAARGPVAVAERRRPGDRRRRTCRQLGRRAAKVYAKCLDGQEATINRRIEAALGEAA